MEETRRRFVFLLILRSVRSGKCVGESLDINSTREYRFPSRSRSSSRSLRREIRLRYMTNIPAGFYWEQSCRKRPTCMCVCNSYTYDNNCSVIIIIVIIIRRSILRKTITETQVVISCRRTSVYDDMYHLDYYYYCCCCYYYCCCKIMIVIVRYVGVSKAIQSTGLVCRYVFYVQMRREGEREEIDRSLAS